MQDHWGRRQIQIREFATRDLLLFAFVLIAGCAGEADQQTSSPETKKAKSKKTSASVSNEAGREKVDQESIPPEEKLVRIDAEGRKWLGEVPYDVWFDDPLAVAGEGASAGKEMPVAAAHSNTTNSSDSASPTRAVDGQTTSAEKRASRTDWSSLIALSVIDMEVKRVRNSLTQRLRTVGTYNDAFKQIQVDGATLAALAGIALQHAESIGWKQRAPDVRDLGMRISESAEGPGKKMYEATRQEYDRLIVVLDGGSPSDLPAAEPNVDFSDSAVLDGLMKRMDRSFLWLKQNVSTAESLTENSEEISQEASLMALFAKVIADESYPMAEEEEYQLEAAGMLEAARQLHRAVASGDYKQFQDSYNNIQQRCDRCHSSYRFSDEF